jgi:hypothetical protein
MEGGSNVIQTTLATMMSVIAPNVRRLFSPLSFSLNVSLCSCRLSGQSNVVERIKKKICVAADYLETVCVRRSHLV